MRKTLTDKGVLALKPRASRYAHPDPQLTGHYVRVMPSRAKSFVCVARAPGGKQVWATLAATDVMGIEEARERARKAIQRIRDGLPPFEAPPNQPKTFEQEAKDWLKRHAEKNKLRSQKQIERLLRVHVYPHWSGRSFLGIRRSDVTELLDRVEDNHSARQADCVLTVVRSVMNWYAARHDNYMPPIVKGMRRQNPKEHQRERILADHEIQQIWKQAEAGGTFGAFVRFALLTAQRRTKVVTMKWSALDGNEWAIPVEKREKGTAGWLVLPEAAMAIVNAQPRLGDNPYVFAGRGNGHFNGFSKSKRRFDAKLQDVAPWTIHDLRRTSRSLMARAGIPSELAEKIMGHTTGGVEAIYDRHSYRDEKADALRRLAALIDGIVHPRDNVLPIQKRKKHR